MASQQTDMLSAAVDAPLMLFTCHGTLVNLAGTTLVHEPIGAGGTPLQLDGAAIGRDARLARMLRGDEQPLVLTRPGLDAEIVVDGKRRIAHLRRGGAYFCAEPGRPDLPCDRAAPGFWESFLLVTQADLDEIDGLFTQSWVQGTSCRIVPPQDVRFREGFVVQVGDVAIDLRYNLPLMSEAGGKTLTILVDGWRIERLHLYRPLIFLMSSGSPNVLDQACMALASLIEFGSYTGHLHLISDQPASYFLERVPGLSPERFSMQPSGAKDWVAYAAAKYAILDHLPARAFQPLLYIDTDVVCDAPIDSLLATIASLDRMSAPIEDMTLLGSNPSVGATLMQRAGHSPRFTSGFNSGTVGIPNLDTCGAALELVRTIISNLSEIFGRDHFRWIDQEVMNYVSYRFGNVDTGSLLRFIRYGWKDDEYDGTRRLGLLHFWPGIEGRPKEDRMRDYVATLRGQRS